MWSHGQDLVLRAVAVHVPLDVEPGLGHRLGPQRDVEVLAPLLERAAPAPHGLDDRAEPPVAPRRQPLGQRGLGVVPRELEGLGAPGRVAQQVDLAAQLLDRVLAEPLERRERLGHEPADRRLDRRALGVAAADVDAVAGQVDDAERVLVGLRRQPGEEVQLDPPPARAERRVDRGVEVFLADELVDDLAHAPGAGLGGEGQARAPGLLDLAGDAHGEGVDPQAGQAHRHLAAAGVVDDGLDRLLDAGEVGGRQAGERHLVVAGARAGPR